MKTDLKQAEGEEGFGYSELAVLIPFERYMDGRYDLQLVNSSRGLVCNKMKRTSLYLITKR